MNDTQEVTYQTLAGMFETRKRDDGSEFISLKDNAPGWAQEFIQEAHGLDMLPDDYRYRWISESLDLLAGVEDPQDADLPLEFADGVSVYTHDLIDWLGSNLNRVTYCDEAAEEGLIEPGADMTRRMMAGQSMERGMVFAQTVEAAKQYLS